MARKFGPFDTSVFYEVENRRLQRALASGNALGFWARLPTGQGLVTAGTGAQLVIAAYPDGALIDGMYVENPTTETVTITTNTGSTNPRTDRLVLRLDMSAKTIAPFQIVGTPAASPLAPAVTQTATVFDLPLCRYTFPGSGSAQNPGSIVDERRPLRGTSGYYNGSSGTGAVAINHALGCMPDKIRLTPSNGPVAGLVQPFENGYDANTMQVVIARSDTGAAFADQSVRFWWEALP